MPLPEYIVRDVVEEMALTAALVAKGRQFSVRDIYFAGCVSGGIEKADKVLGLEGALFWEACDVGEKLVGVFDEYCKLVGV